MVKIFCKISAVAVAEMGDRLTTIDMGRRVGSSIPTFDPCLLSMSMSVSEPTIPALRRGLMKLVRDETNFMWVVHVLSL